MSVLEKRAENATVKYARERGVLVRKMNGLGFNHWPDRMFCVPGGKPIFIEFKAPGKDPTPAQADIHEQLRSAGYEVHVTDSKVVAIGIISKRMGTCAVSKARSKVPVGARSRRPLARSRNAKD